MGRSLRLGPISKLEQLRRHSDKRTLDGHQLVKISVAAQGYDKYKRLLDVK
jgi:hypothetical protein